MSPIQHDLRHDQLSGRQFAHPAQQRNREKWVVTREDHGLVERGGLEGGRNSAERPLSWISIRYQRHAKPLIVAIERSDNRHFSGDFTSNRDHPLDQRQPFRLKTEQSFICSHPAAGSAGEDCH